jgi:hypothetical protein
MTAAHILIVQADGGEQTPGGKVIDGGTSGRSKTFARRRRSTVSSV